MKLPSSEVCRYKRFVHCMVLPSDDRDVTPVADGQLKSTESSYLEGPCEFWHINFPGLEVER